MNSTLKILIAGGGTGGHIIPALAVARALVERHAAEVILVGTARGLESRLVPEAGFPLKLIDVGPLKSVSLMTRLRTLTNLPRSIGDCKRLMREFRPGAVLGVGGYASGPAMVAALRLKIPAIAFEPNAMPGLANRLVGKWVRAAAINFPAAATWFRNPEVTGVPVRPEFFSLDAPSGAPHLLVFGGSQGARTFNTHLPHIIRSLLDEVPGLTVLHQSGTRNFEATHMGYAASGADPTRWLVRPFLDDMAAEFARAHLIMSRSVDCCRGGGGRQAGAACSFCRRNRSAPETQRRSNGGSRSRGDAEGIRFGHSRQIALDPRRPDHRSRPPGYDGRCCAHASAPGGG